MFARLSNDLGLGARLSGGFILSLVGMLLITVPVLILVINGLIDRAIKKEVQGHYDLFMGTLDAEITRAASLVTLVAQLPPVTEAMAAGDRARLANLFVPGWAPLAAAFGIEQMQFHTPPATSFLRVHQPAKFGDDLSGFRQTVVAANAGRRLVVGLEAGIAGLGIRAVAPITGDHPLGTVEFGLSLGQPLIERIKKQQGVEVSVFLPGRDGIPTALASSVGGVPFTGSADLNAALAGRQVLRRVTVDGRPRAVLVAGLADYSGHPVAAVELAVDVSAYHRAWTDALLVAGLATPLALALAAGFTMLVRRWVIRDIIDIAATVERLAGGDLLAQVPGTGRRDEIGTIARSVRVLQAASLEKQRLERERTSLKLQTEVLTLSDLLEREADITVGEVSYTNGPGQ